MQDNPSNILRQCEYLRVQGQEIAKTSGFVMFTLDRDEYFAKLRDYLAFYQEIKAFMEKQEWNNELISERVEQLPNIPYEDFSFSGQTWVIWITLLFLYLLFPLAYIMLFRGVNYVDSTRSKIHQATATLSSIAFLLKAEEN